MEGFIRYRTQSLFLQRKFKGGKKDGNVLE